MTTPLFTPNENSLDTEEIITIHFTNINSNSSISKIYEEVLFFKIGEIIKITLSSYLPTNKDIAFRKSDAHISFKYFDKILLEKLNNQTEPIKFYQNTEEETLWYIQKKEKEPIFFHQERCNDLHLVIYTIKANKTIHDINYIFREHGCVDQVDYHWEKGGLYPFPIRSQAYVYFKEWGDEIYTYKFLDELKNKGVVTIKYNYEGEKDFLWVYKLYPVVENTIDYGYEFGNYYNWKPKDETENRLLKNNNLSWLFTTAGKFAYSKKIAEEELLPHGGLFIETGIGVEKTLFEIEIVEKPHPFDVIRKILKTSNEGVYGNYGTFENGELYINEAEADDEEIQQMIIRVIKKKLKVVNKQDTMFFTSISNNELN